jgi:hypothetical protein
MLITEKIRLRGRPGVAAAWHARLGWSLVARDSAATHFNTP